MNKISPSKRIDKALRELLEKEYTRKHSVFYSFYRLAIQKAVQELLEQEIESCLDRGPYERTLKPVNEKCRDGYKQRSLKTAEEYIPIQSCQLRDTDEVYQSKLVLSNWRRNSKSRNKGLLPFILTRTRKYCSINVQMSHFI